VKISPFVYSSVQKKHENFLFLLETDQLEALGSLGVVIIETTIMAIQ